MTDINPWPELVQVVQMRHRKADGRSWQNGPEGEPIFNQYVTLPFNEYTLGHLVGMLARSEDNGDWHGEITWMCLAAMDRVGIKQVTTNWGDTFTYEQIRSGEFVEIARRTDAKTTSA